MRRYYRPGLTEGEADALDWQNMVLVSAAQAALGLISPGIRAIFVAASTGRATLHVVLAAGEDGAVAEDVADLVGDLEALLSHTPDFAGVTAETYVDRLPADWRAEGWMGLYWSKGWVPEPAKD